MKKARIGVFVLIGFVSYTIVAQSTVSDSQMSGDGAFANKYGSDSVSDPIKSVPSFRPRLNFEVNAGQTDKSVRFLARGQGYDLYLTEREAVFAFRRLMSVSKPANDERFDKCALRMKFMGANTAPQVTGVDRVETESNYMTGADSSAWITHVANYSKVRYTALYPGVDLDYYGNDRGIEYDLEVGPGASVDQVDIDLDGATNLQLQPDGDLGFRCGFQKISMQKPAIYQLSATGSRVAVPGSWRMSASHRLGFAVPNYDHSKELIIDPILNFNLSFFPFATYLGGTGSDVGYGIAVDSSGSYYVTGQTTSTDFPTTSGVLQASFPAGQGGTAAFVTKYKSDGTRVYSTFLGGATDVQNPNGTSSTSTGYSVAVNAAGNAFVAGHTLAHGSFPTSPASTGCSGNPITACSDAFLVELSTDGSKEVFGAFIDGNSANAIALDTSGNIYLTGNSAAGVPPALGTGLQSGFGGGTYDAFVAKVSSTGSLTWWTYLGGDGDDTAYGIALDPQGNIYVTGATNALANNGTTNSFPVFNAYQPIFGGGTDGFVAEINNSGSKFIYSTFLGGSGLDAPKGIAVDASGDAIVTGQTFSLDFPVFNPLQATGVGNNAFFTKFAPSGTALVYSTYFGGTGGAQGEAVTVDPSNGNTFFAGSISTIATTDPLTGLGTIGTIDSNLMNIGLVTGSSASNTIQPQCGNADICNNAFVTEISPAGDQFLYFTYLGGSGADAAFGIALDKSTNCSQSSAFFTSPLGPPCIYATGSTTSSDFPVSDSSALQGSPNAFVAMVPSIVVPVCSTTLTQVGLKGTAGIKCIQNFTGGQGTVNWGDQSLSQISLSSSSAQTSATHLYAKPITVAPSVSMTDSAGTSTTYSTPFPPTQFGPITVTVTAPSCPINGTATSCTILAPSSLQFNAVVTNASDTSINPWEVNSTPGGSPALGLISPSGLYTPPSGLLAPQTVPVIAVSNADGITQSAPFLLTVDPPVQVTVTPGGPTVTAGSAPITVTAQVSSYSPSPNVTWAITGSGCSGSPCGSISTTGPSTTTVYTPPAELPGSTSIADTLTATSVSETSQSGQTIVTVSPLPVQVSISPTSSSVVASQSSPVQFVATVTGPSNKAVTWSLSGNGCNNAPCGTLSPAGLYTPPSTPIAGAPQTDTVTATAQADSAKSASAKVTINDPAISVTLTPSTKSVQAGSSLFTVTAQVSSYASSPNVLWSLTGTGCNGSPCGSISSAGPGTSTNYTPPARLPSAASATDTLTATSTADPTKSAQLVITITPLGIGISINPPSATVTAAQSQPIQFTATVTGPSNTAVTWTLSGIGCSNGPCGTLSATGLYTPPRAMIANAPQTDTVTATSQASTSVSVSAQVTINNPVISVTVNPATQSVQAGSAPFTVTAQVPAFASNANVLWKLSGTGCSGSPCGSISTSGPSTSTIYTPPAKLTSTSPITDTLTATSVADATRSAQALINVSSLPIAVSIAPTAATVIASQSAPVQFAATVTGSSNTAVTWSLTGTGCNNAPCGTLGSNGLYTPPATTIANPPQSDTVTATSQADGSTAGSAFVTIDDPIIISIAPSGVAGQFSIEVGTSQSFIAIVGGSSNTGVTWSVTGTGCNGGPCGTIDQSGNYTAPATLSSPQTDTITATARADVTKSASVQAVIFVPATATPPPAVTVAAGQTANYTVTLSPGTGDPVDPVMLTCGNLPNGTSCQFSPNPLAAGGTSFTVKVATTAPTSSSLRRGSSMTLAWITPLASLFFFLRRFRERRRSLLTYSGILVISLFIATLLTACGTGGSFGVNQQPSPLATPAGEYTINVIGTPQVVSGQVRPAAFVLTNLTLTVK